MSQKTEKLKQFDKLSNRRKKKSKKEAQNLRNESICGVEEEEGRVKEEGMVKGREGFTNEHSTCVSEKLMVTHPCGIKFPPLK